MTTVTLPSAAAYAAAEAADPQLARLIASVEDRLSRRPDPRPGQDPDLDDDFDRMCLLLERTAR